MHGSIGSHPRSSSVSSILMRGTKDESKNTPSFQQKRKRKGDNMLYINLIIVLVAVGVILWLINSYVPMDYKIKSTLNIVIVIGLLIWLVSVLGGVPIFEIYLPR